jgi:hypothetical protein
MNSSVELPRLDHKSKERRVCGLIWWGAHSTLPHAFFMAVVLQKKVILRAFYISEHVHF